MNSPTARPVVLLLNVAHAIDHMFLLIFATAVAAIAADFGFADWESLMPYGVGAFLLFGLGSLPAGRLGDLWGRRQMMLVFFFGMGVSMLLVAVTRNAWKVTDEDVAAVKAAGVPEDQIFELAVCASLGQSTRQLDAALAALDAAEVSTKKAAP